VEERHTSPVELLWDLVFVFAVTQVTTLLSPYVWAANAEQEESHRRVTCRALEAGGGDRRRGAGLAHRERLRGDHVYLGLPAKDPQPREIVGLPKDTVKKIVHTEFSNCSGSAASRQSGMRERTASIARRTR
jgi:hypothetical protein